MTDCELQKLRLSIIDDITMLTDKQIAYILNELHDTQAPAGAHTEALP